MLEPIPVEENSFAKALDALLEENFLLSTPAVHGIVALKQYDLDANRWVVHVGNDLEAALLKKHQEPIIAFLREHTGNPTIQLATEVVQMTLPEETRRKMLLGSELLEEMRAKNPALETLLHRFEAKLKS